MLVLILASNAYSIIITEETHQENVQLTQLACRQTNILRGFIPLVDATDAAQRKLAIHNLNLYTKKTQETTKC